VKSLQGTKEFAVIGAEGVALPPSKQPFSGLPDPDLTPSLNPTLARNLGRWAEVYFTTPPEQRDAAVQKLLHELQEAEQKRLGWRGAETAPGTPVSAELREQTVAVEARQFPVATEQIESVSSVEVPELLAQTAEPGTSAPSDSRRSPLTEILQATAPSFESSAAVEATLPSTEVILAWNGNEALTQPLMVARGGAAVGSLVPETATADQPAANVGEISRVLRPVTGSRPGTLGLWRKIGAVAAAVMVVVLIRTVIKSRETRPTFSTLPAVSSVAAPSSQERASSSTTPNGVVPSAGTHPPTLQPAASHESEPSVASAPKQDATPELAMAERYRSGKGVPQDSAQAAHWLWQAVAKESGDALERLAGMYATGDGVPRDCDQARVLAGAAAKKLPQDAVRMDEELRAAGCQ
jgi:hypothetical protein